MTEVADKLLSVEVPRRYLLLHALGHTRRSAVFAAVDQVLVREVALKIHLRREDARRALLEARVMARIDHPNVVRVFELGEEGGWIYATMELCESNLGTWAVGQPWTEVLDRVLEAGRGLAAVHEAGLIHGDVKPENVLVDGEGTAKLGDFGFATAPGPSIRIPGTVGFIAPEIAAGERGPAGDVFALACTGWACLFGVAPFGEPPPRADASAAAMVLMERALAGEIVAREHGDVPARLVAALMDAVVGDPARRPTLEQALARWEACRDRRWSCGGVWRRCRR